MAKKRGATKRHHEALEFLRMGGTQIPAGFASKAAAVTESMLREKLTAGTASRRRGAKLFGRADPRSQSMIQRTRRRSTDS